VGSFRGRGAYTSDTSAGALRLPTSTFGFMRRHGNADCPIAPPARQVARPGAAYDSLRLPVTVLVDVVRSTFSVGAFF